jgi:hypothetical protein
MKIMIVKGSLAMHKRLCMNCRHLDPDMYMHLSTYDSTVYGCGLFEVRLFNENKKPLRCTECKERGGQK